MTIDTTELLAPQVEHVRKLVDSLYFNGFALDMSETGTGKSYAAAAVAREMNRPLVLISPKTVIPQWEKVLKTFGLRAKVIINYEKLGRGNTKWMKWKKLPDPSKPWKETATDLLPDFRFPRDSLVILDEGHRCKGNHTSNSQMMIMLAEQGYKILVASATMATTPMEMKAVGYLSGLHALYNFTDFCRTHGAEMVGQWGAMTWDMSGVEAKKSMMRLNEYFFETRECASRMTVDDFGELFPESHIIPNAFDMGVNGAKIADVYDQMDAEIAKLSDATKNYSEHIFAVLMKARREVELLKVPLIVEKIEELYTEGKSVVVFVNFSQTIFAISSRLVKNKMLASQIAFVVGGQTDNVREQDIEDFQADKKRIILCNIAAGGVGINLHDLNGKFPRASIISPTWSACNLRQCMGRVWRQGGLTKSVQFIVYAANCIEENICRRVEFKLNNLNTLNDGDLAEVVGLI